MANSADLDEMAHYEQSHQDLRCLQIQLFPSVVLKDLSSYIKTIDLGKSHFNLE